MTLLEGLNYQDYNSGVGTGDMKSSSFCISRAKINIIELAGSISSDYVEFELFTNYGEELRVLFDIYYYREKVFIVNKLLTKNCILKFIKRQSDLVWFLFPASLYNGHPGYNVIKSQEFLL